MSPILAVPLRVQFGWSAQSILVLEGVLAVLAGGEVALLKHFVGAEDGLAELAGDSGTRTGISCHNSLSFKN